MDLTPILVAAQSPDAGVRQAAEGQLTALRASNPPAFLHALAAELAAEAKPAEARQIAGLILKNALDAPSESKKVKDVTEGEGVCACGPKRDRGKRKRRRGGC
jgi:importin subunit beta-1